MRRVITLVGAGLALAGVLAGCAGGGDYHYVKNSRKQTYFRVPSSWKLFEDENAIIDVAQPDLNRLQRSRELRRSWQVAFDADPEPTLGHLFRVTADEPWGLASTTHLSFRESDGVSTSALRNLYFDIDAAVQGDFGKIVSYEEFDQEDGLHGIHFVAKLVTDDNVRITVDQTTMLSQDRSKLYSLLLSCSSRCYRERKGRIEKVVDSWTVKAG